MNAGSRLVVVGLIAIASLVGGASQASAGPQGDYFVVNTQFVDAPSAIVDAGGAFADCTSVVDLGGITEQIGPRKVIFIGDKLVQCDGGEILIHYNATLNFESGKKTSGHWYIADSTVAGATSGFGTVRGDSSACELVEGSEGCILDVFAGDVE